MRIRGRDAESEAPLFSKIRSRIVSVLKFAALSNDIPVETVSTHSLRAGGNDNYVPCWIWFARSKGMGKMGIFTFSWLSAV